MDISTFALSIFAAWGLPAWLAWDPPLTYATWSVLLVVGVAIAIRKAPAQGGWVEKIVLCAPVFVGAPMAAFGTEPFLDPVSIGALMPAWIPVHMFWVYLVGTCLILGGLSIVVQQYAWLSAGLFGIMMVCFEILMIIPALAEDPRNRISWVLFFREFTFGTGALSFAAMHTEAWRSKGRHWLISVGRVVIGAALIFYAVEQFLHPDHVPAVPLERLTPTWIPGYLLWTYLTGAVYAVGGACLLLNKRARLAA